MKVDLIKNTISNGEIDALSDWLRTYPRLTQGEKVREFEKEFAAWQGRKHCISVNSGSSANLLVAYVLSISGIRNKKVVIPALSWATTLAPWIQLGFTPYLCDADEKNLGVDLEHLETLFKTHDPSILMVVNVLGFPNYFDEVKNLCEKYNVILVEDSCECVGSEYKGIKVGNFGSVSTFSGYMAHHFSFIEGGLICTDDDFLNQMFRMTRSHGWGRDIDPAFNDFLKEKYGVNDFESAFTFYVPGFNFRITEIQGFLGLGQVRQLNRFCDKREQNFNLYQDKVVNPYWKPMPVGNKISNFAYPVMTPKRSELVDALKKNDIDCRPLIAGDLSRHPVWKEFGTGGINLPFASRIHSEGLYLPNNDAMSVQEIEFVCSVVNEVTKNG